MKILILANNDVGLYKFRKELMAEMIAQNNEVYISLPDGQYISALKQMGCHYVKTEFERRGTNIFDDIKLIIFYWKAISEIKPDIVLTYTIKPNIYGGMVCRIKRIPYLMNITGLGTAIRNKSIMSELLLRLYMVSAKSAEKIFFQNVDNKAFFEKQGIKKEKAKLIPGSGVNLHDHCLEKYPENDGTIRLLFIGRIMKDKGIIEFLDCAEKITFEYKNVKFDIIGDYDEMVYKDRIDDLAKKGIVEYYGQQNDVHSFIKSHHATILPSYHEGLSNVLLETASTGRPVLASNISGCKETFEETKTGLGFEPRNSQELIETCRKFLQLTYDEKANMGIEGRRKMEREFDRKIVIDAYMKVINEIEKRMKNV